MCDHHLRWRFKSSLLEDKPTIVTIESQTLKKYVEVNNAASELYETASISMRRFALSIRR